MTRIWQEGYETYDDGDTPKRGCSFHDSYGIIDPDKYFITEANTSFARPASGGSKGMQLKIGRSGAAGSEKYYYGAMHIPLGGEKTHVHYRTYFRFEEHNTTASNYGSFLSFDWLNGSNRNGGLLLSIGTGSTSTQTMLLTSGGTTYPAGTDWNGTFVADSPLGAFPAPSTTWHLLEIEIYHDNNTRVDSYVKVWVDNTEYLNLEGSGACDITDGEDGFNTLRWGVVWFGKGAHYYNSWVDIWFDDMAINEVTGDADATNEGRCGDGSIIAYAPASDGIAQDWIRSTGSSSFALVDGLPVSGSGNLTTTEAGQKVHFGTTITTAYDFVNSVSIGVRGGSGGGTSSIKGQFVPLGGGLFTKADAITPVEGVDTLIHFGSTMEGQGFRFDANTINNAQWGLESNG